MRVTGIKLKVLDAKQRDVAIGIARINQKTMKELSVTSGDAIEIEGKRKTSAFARSAYPEEQSLEVIRMDGFIRKNAGVPIDEYVIVHRAEVESAKSIVLSPIEFVLKPVTIKEDIADFVKQRLMERTFIEGDTTLIMIRGRPFQFVVLETQPEGIVRMTHDTQLQIEKEPFIKREVSVMTRLSHEDLKQIDKLIGIGLFDSRSEAVAFLTHEGIVAKRETLEQLTGKLTEIRKIRDEAKEMLSMSTFSVPLLKPQICPRCGSENSEEAKFCSNCGEKMVVGERND